MRWLIAITLLVCLQVFAQDIPAEGGYAYCEIPQPGTDLTDFTVKIDLANMPASWWSAVDTSDGTKGRVTKSDGTRLEPDWIDFDDTGETGQLSVKWSGTLSATLPNILYIYYPRASMASVATDATYGGENAYDAATEGYWPDGGGVDRTANGNNLTAAGGVTAGGVTGKLGNGTYYDGSDDVFSIASALVSGAPCTISTWFNAPDVTAYHRLVQVSDDDTVSANKDMLGIQAAGASTGDPIQAYIYRGVTTGTANGPTYSSSTWQMATGVFVSTESRFAYLNSTPGSEITTSVTPNAMTITRLGALYFSGTLYYSEQTLNQTYIISDVRSDDWIAYDYNQTNDNATYFGTWSFSAASSSGWFRIPKTIRVGHHDL